MSNRSDNGVPPRLLALGDLHLGRVPTRIPALARIADEVGPRAALDAAVDAALSHRVRAVLFAGDVIDRDNRFFEAWAALDGAVRRLADHGVQVLAVAGNHDVETLPRLAREVDGFELLGEGGSWQASEIRDADGRPCACVVGWSYPSEVVRRSPLADTLPDDLPTDLPVVGLLHADLDAAQSPHAPVSRAELDAARPDAWLLGHVHAPSSLDRARPVGYLGSLVGLDPTESGPHGPLLVDLGPGRDLDARRLPLAPLRWEHQTLDASDFEAAQDLDAALGTVLARVLDGLADAAPACPRAVGVRVRVEGHTDHGAALRARARAVHERLEEFALVRGDRIAAIESVAIRTSPPIDLAALARGHDPLAHVASAVLTLEAGAQHPHYATLIEDARRALGDEAARDAWSELDDLVLDDESVRQRLLEAGREAIETLLRQRAPEDG